MLRFLRRVRKPAADLRPAEPRYGDAVLLAQADEFNRRADGYWREVAGEASGRRHALNKPFSALQAAPDEVYRLGLMLAELRLGVGLTVLDFGAGSCWLASCLNRLGCRTVAVDVSPAALDLGRELFGLDARHRAELEPRFLEYDGHRIPLPDESVDRIACFDAFHHVPNQDEVLREMFRVLRWGGRAVLAEPGQGHTHSDASAFDEERFAVLENDLDPLDLERRARREGFTDVRLKPYPQPSALSVTPGEYVDILQGDVSRFPMGRLPDGLRSHLTFTLAKGEHVADSRCPGVLRAEVRLLAPPPAELRKVGGVSVPMLLELRNTGDTIWRHAVGPPGGSVFLGVHLLDQHRRILKIDFYRVPLPEDVSPGGTARVLGQIPLPPEPGCYFLRFDPVDDEVAWFSQAGSAALNIEIEVDHQARVAHLAAGVERLDGDAAIRVHAGARVSVPVRITNLSPCGWPSLPGPHGGAIRLGAQLLDAAGGLIEQDFGRYDLPRSLQVNECAEVRVDFQAPADAASYRLRLDMLQEEVCWFAERGSSPFDIPLTVTSEPTDSADPGVLHARIEVLDPGPAIRATRGARVPMRVRVTNRGNTRWLRASAAGIGHVALGGSLRGETGTDIRDYLRAPLSRDVNPGETLEIETELRIPEQAGLYRLELDMVDEGIAWFASEGSPVSVLRLEVG